MGLMIKCPCYVQREKVCHIFFARGSVGLSRSVVGESGKVRGLRVGRSNLNKFAAEELPLDPLFSMLLSSLLALCLVLNLGIW